MVTGASRLLIAVLVAVTALGTVVQARMNGELVVITGNPFEVGALNLGVAMVVATIFVLSRTPLRRSWKAMVRLLRVGQIRWWECLAGVGGAYFVTTQSASVPVLGVAVFTVSVVAGQTSNSALLDRLGFGPAGRQPVSALRLLAAVVAVVAVAVSVSDRFTVSSVADSRLALAFALLALSAGVVSAFQAALNGRVGRTVGHPLIAGWLNFAVGFSVSLPVAALLSSATGRSLGSLPWERPWLLAGGVLGMLYVTTVAWATRPLGLLLAAVLSVVGLLVGALLIDLVAPTAGTQFGWHLVAGVLLALAAAAMAALGRATGR